MIVYLEQDVFIISHGMASVAGCLLTWLRYHGNHIELDRDRDVRTGSFVVCVRGLCFSLHPLETFRTRYRLPYRWMASINKQFRELFLAWLSLSLSERRYLVFI